MKIIYQSCTENIEIEVTEEWAAVIRELDREEYNSDHRETRRHCSLDALNLDNAYLPSDTDVEAEVAEFMENERLFAALATLEPRQQTLVRRVYMNGETMVSIAAEEGVSVTAIQNRMKKIHARLKKILD